MDINIERINGVAFLSIVNIAGMKVTLSSCGAGIEEISLDGIPMTMSEAGHENWANATSFAGKTVGRVAGRIKKGKLKFNGKKYNLYHNENGKTCHHGGTRLFSYGNHPYAITVGENETIVEFSIKDEESKFPGKVEVKVRYIISNKENRVRIEYKTTSDEKTPINLTNHTYFSLGESSLDALTMKLEAESIAKYNKDLIQVKMRKIPGRLNFNEEKSFKGIWKMRELKKKRLLGIDHAYKRASCDDKSSALVLKSTKYQLDVLTSLPAIHLYSSNFINEGAMMNNGEVASVHNSLAIEPQYLAGDYESMTVTPDAIKEDFIEYRFKRI